MPAPVLVKPSHGLAAIEPGGGEQLLLLAVRSGIVAAAHVGRLRRGDRAERGRGIRGLRDLRGILARPRDHEVVLHDRRASERRARRDELLLALRIVRDDHVGIAVGAHPERRAAAHRDHLHRDSGTLAKHREQRVEQPGVLHAGGGREQELGLFGRRCGRERTASESRARAIRMRGERASTGTSSAGRIRYRGSFAQRAQGARSGRAARRSAKPGASRASEDHRARR